MVTSHSAKQAASMWSVDRAVPTSYRSMTENIVPKSPKSRTEVWTELKTHSILPKVCTNQLLMSRETHNDSGFTLGAPSAYPVTADP